MAELLVMTSDHTNLDQVLDAKLHKRGDVIAIGEDGHPWGVKELSLPIFRVVKIAGEPADRFAFLMSPEHPPGLDREYTMLRNRVCKLDLDTLAVSELAQGVSKTPTTMTVAEVESTKTVIEKDHDGNDIERLVVEWKQAAKSIPVIEPINLTAKQIETNYSIKERLNEPDQPLGPRSKLI